MKNPPKLQKVPLAGIIFTSIIGVGLLFAGLGHIVQPENDSVMVQIFGIIELCTGWLMIGITLLLHALRVLSNNQIIR